MHLVESIFKECYLLAIFVYVFEFVKVQSTYLQHMKNYENFNQYYFFKRCQADYWHAGAWYCKCFGIE